MDERKYHKFLRRIAKVKQKARSELLLRDWDCLEYYKNFYENYSQPNNDNIKRVNAKTMKRQEFVNSIESIDIPVILTGLMDDWRANERWSVMKLGKKYRNQLFKCGEDDNGHSVKLKMKYFIEYMQNTHDDSPLYIFDSSFGERHKTRKLLDDYSVPTMFLDDLFRYARRKSRPPYRWFVMGPARSGTGIHVDPLGTSAWNALVSGQKKWCFFPPDTPKNLVLPTKSESDEQIDEAITWFASVYKRVLSPSWPKKYKPIQGIQHPGELVFVPSGWWHVVLNLTETVAVTQNFCSTVNLSKVWLRTVKGRPNFAKHWLRHLHTERPELIPVIENASNPRENRIDLCPSSSSSSCSSSSIYSSCDDDDDANNYGRGYYKDNDRDANAYRNKYLSEILANTRKRLLSRNEFDNLGVCPPKIARSP